MEVGFKWMCFGICWIHFGELLALTWHLDVAAMDLVSWFGVLCLLDALRFVRHRGAHFCRDMLISWPRQSFCVCFPGQGGSGRARPFFGRSLAHGCIGPQPEWRVSRGVWGSPRVSECPLTSTRGNPKKASLTTRVRRPSWDSDLVLTRAD